MKSDSFRFDRFTLDVSERMLRRDGAALDVSNRYFDALTLLVTEPGGLVSKDRFMDEVWRGVPVTDEALTQCIKSLRRALGDDASRPRFIETVPKHGYRFIAPVERVNSGRGSINKSVFDWRMFFMLAGAGVVGGGVAGLIGGLFYGFVGAAQPFQPGMGAGSIVLVMTALSVVIALMGAIGVSLGVSAALVKKGGWQMTVGGGAVGGLLIGGTVKLFGLDAFNLLLGISPGNVTGAVEGAAIGGAVGLGTWLSERHPQFRIWPAALVGAITGITITALGGKLLGGSIDLLAKALPQSRLRLDQVGALLGEDHFGLRSQLLTGGVEGMLFTGCVAFAMMSARRQIEDA